MPHHWHNICCLNFFSWDRRDDKQYASNKKVKTEMINRLKEESTEIYEAEIHAVIRRWNVVIERNDDYVEK